MSTTDLVVSPNAPALEMTGVTVNSLEHPEEVVLEEVNWKVMTGEFWAVGGLLRSGKSDLMALAAGIMLPTRGSYRVFGEELLAGFDQAQRRLRLGLVFDGGKLLHQLTLADNVALPLRYHFGALDVDLEPRLRALVEFTGLEPWAGRFPGQVSRNWQQRFGLARALALKPDVLLLDNPMAGLDPRDGAWWTETVSALASGHRLLEARPLTIVVTGDNLQPWAARATHFAVLKDRHFVNIGTRATLADHEEPLLKELWPRIGLAH